MSPRSNAPGHVASNSNTNSATTKLANAIALNNSLFVLSFPYATKARVEMNTASVIPPMCNTIWARWKVCRKCGTIIGIANIPTIPATIMEKSEDFLSTIRSGLNMIYHKLTFYEFKITGSSFEMSDFYKKCYEWII